MTIDIPYEHLTHFKGRNGVADQKGVQVLAVEGFPVELRPLNTRGVSDSAQLRVEATAIPALIEALERARAVAEGDAA